MMKSAPSSNTRLHRHQRGDTLLEALVGTLLLGIVGLGTTYVAARSVNAQRFAATQGAVVQQMRQTIEAQGVDRLCQTDSITLTLEQSVGGKPHSIAAPLQVQCQSVAVQVAVKNDGLYTVKLPSTVQRLELRTVSSDPSLQELLGAGVIRMAQ